MKVTFVYMLMCGPGIQTVMQISRGVLTPRGTFTRKVCLRTVVLPEGQKLGLNGEIHKQLAEQHETAEFPAWWRVAQ
jgi:hypothetical protein